MERVESIVARLPDSVRVDIEAWDILVAPKRLAKLVMDEDAVFGVGEGARHP